MEMSGNAERDLAVQSVIIQTIQRDLGAEKDEREALEKRVRSLEDTLRWVLGAAAVIGAILAVVSTPLAKALAVMVQQQ